MKCAELGKRKFSGNLQSQKKTSHFKDAGAKTDQSSSRWQWESRSKEGWYRGSGGGGEKPVLNKTTSWFGEGKGKRGKSSRIRKETSRSRMGHVVTRPVIGAEEQSYQDISIYSLNNQVDSQLQTNVGIF